MSHRLLSAGERGVLVELDDLDAVLALNPLVRQLRERSETPWDAVVDVIPAARTLLFKVSEASAVPALRRELEALLTAQSLTVSALGFHESHRSDNEVVIPVHYDGPDLADISRLTGLSVEEVIAAHTGTPWRMAFGGFAPGFPYLVGGDPRLEVPRRTEPRTVVPAGAVGLAGHFSGIYPRESPGGWQLLGHTRAVLWDVDRDPPALIQPGWIVRFVREED